MNKYFMHHFLEYLKNTSDYKCCEEIKNILIAKNIHPPKYNWNLCEVCPIDNACTMTSDKKQLIKNTCKKFTEIEIVEALL